MDEERISILYWYEHGMGEWVLPQHAVPDVLAPSTVGPAPAGDLKAMGRTMIEQALQNARFNKSRAAKALGLTRRQLYIRMRKHGVD